MAIQRLAHFTVRTTALRDTVRFYTEVLGLREGWRPPFDFPGAWLYCGGDTPEHAAVHLIVGEAGDHGGAAVDHVAFNASDLSGVRSRLRAHGLIYREQVVPQLGLHQLFCKDPCGVTIELTFAGVDDA
ncbi:VOC family protein [Ramlibacter monticola]|uniref:VOC family protein n=1 Tax=Ramlibacter monticola TaxID=1926872 RepID=A0A936ZA68_9BURK|nr:VOC family protein [Ramlibacter monticola]MBL0395227.1 VOC family protein [Ramlibacter monticola]